LYNPSKQTALKKEKFMEHIMEILQPALRWIHIVAGITWIGHLYFFNFVNAHFASTLDAESKKKVVPELMPRALWWFRMGAAWTWITGVFLLTLVFYHGGAQFEADQSWNVVSIALVLASFLGVFVYDAIFKNITNEKVGVVYASLVLALVYFLFIQFGHFSYRAAVIHLGATFGTIMAFNVWFCIWPAQQKIIRAIKNGEAPDAALAKMAGLRSKHNTYMSVPLVWMMINQHTYYFASWPYAILGIIVLSWWVVSLLYKKSKTVKGF